MLIKKRGFKTLTLIKGVPFTFVTFVVLAKLIDTVSVTGSRHDEHYYHLRDRREYKT